MDVNYVFSNVSYSYPCHQERRYYTGEMRMHTSELVDHMLNVLPMV